MKKTICWLSAYLMMCFTMVTSACAQNESYKDLMVRVLKAGESGGMQNLKQMAPSFGNMATESVGKKHPEMNETQKTALATEFVEKYLQKQGYEDMAEAMMPCYEKYISIEDLKVYVEVVESEQYQSMSKRMAAATEKTTAGLMAGMMGIATGEIPEPITAVECTDSYRQCFKNYYAMSGGDKIIEQLMTSLSTLLQQGLQQAGGEDAEKKEMVAKLIDSMFNYLKDNFETFMLNTFIESGFTEEDLNYFAEITEKQMPVTNKTLVVMQELLGDMDSVMKFSQKIMGGFSTWLESQEF